MEIKKVKTENYYKFSVWIILEDIPKGTLLIFDNDFYQYHMLKTGEKPFSQTIGKNNGS